MCMLSWLCSLQRWAGTLSRTLWTRTTKAKRQEHGQGRSKNWPVCLWVCVNTSRTENTISVALIDPFHIVQSASETSSPPSPPLSLRQILSSGLCVRFCSLPGILWEEARPSWSDNTSVALSALCGSEGKRFCVYLNAHPHPLISHCPPSWCFLQFTRLKVLFHRLLYSIL